MEKIRRLAYNEVKKYLKEVKKWKLVNNKMERNFIFKDFKDAIKFVNKVADIAEEQKHHPDILVYSWNKVRLTIYTHSINGLSENDFDLASKINKVL